MSCCVEIVWSCPGSRGGDNNYPVSGGAPAVRCHDVSRQAETAARPQISLPHNSRSDFLALYPLLFELFVIFCILTWPLRNLIQLLLLYELHLHLGQLGERELHQLHYLLDEANIVCKGQYTVRLEYISISQLMVAGTFQV